MSLLFILSLVFIVIGKTMQNILNKVVSLKSSTIETSIYIRLIPVLLILPFLYLSESLYLLSFELLSLSIFTGLLLGLGTILLTRAYKIGEVSVVTPFYSFNPIFGGIFSWVLLSQDLSVNGIIGILLITFGGYIIKINKFEGFMDPIKRIFKDRGIVYLFLYSLIIGFISPFDSFGVNSVSPGLWLFYTYLFASLSIIVYYVYINGLNFSISGHDYKNYSMFFGIGFFTFVSVISLFYAYQYLEVAYVLSIFMLNIVLTSVVGIFIYDEKVYFNKILAIVLMTVGAIIVILA